MSDLYTHNCLYWILCFCYFVHCLFVYLYIVIFVVCVLSCCSHSVALWRFCYYNKFLVCVNIPGQYILILLFYLIITEYKPFTSIQSTDIYFTVIIVRVPNMFLHEVLHVVFKHLVFVAIDIFSCCIVCRTRSAQNSSKCLKTSSLCSIQSKYIQLFSVWAVSYFLLPALSDRGLARQVSCRSSRSMQLHLSWWKYFAFFSYIFYYYL